MAEIAAGINALAMTFILSYGIAALTAFARNDGIDPNSSDYPQ